MPQGYTYDSFGNPYSPHYFFNFYPGCSESPTTTTTTYYTSHEASSESETIPVKYDAYGYGPGDGSIYQIESISGKSRLRRLGLTHMSDAWKEYMLAHYESKRPDRKFREARRNRQQAVDQQ